MSFIVVRCSMLRLHLDDPLDAVAVHGLVGIMSVPCFMNVGLENGERGIFWDGGSSFPWMVLAHNIGGVVCIILWSMFWCFLLFGSLHLCNMLRVATDVEFQGMDLIKHGESVYPAAVSYFSIFLNPQLVVVEIQEDMLRSPLNITY